MSIWKPVNDRIVQASRGTENEIIGLLLGQLQDDAIIIEDSVTGEYSAEPQRATLSSDALAKIADALVTGRLHGNIVGWYHSHVEGGLFFSQTDVATQRILQQFSGLIAAMVVDASNGDVGFFRVDQRTGEPIRIPSDKIRIYSDKSEAIPPQAEAIAPVATPIIEVRRRAASRPYRPTRLVVSVLLVVLVASLALLGIFLYGGTQPSTALTITHTPISTAIIGTPIDLEATVSGKTQNLTLTYAAIGSTALRTVLMNPITSDTYAYQIPGEQVTGNMAYTLSAFDTAGNRVSTSTYVIVVGDFTLISRNTAVTVYRNSTQASTAYLTLLPTNGFAEPVSLTATGLPQGVEVSFSPNPTQPSSTSVRMTLAAGLNAPNGTTSISVLATYAPTGSSPVVRQANLALTVTDFALHVNPSSNTVSKGSAATYTVSIAFQEGFADTVALSVVGIPEGATFLLTTNNATLIGRSSGTSTVTLQISIPQQSKAGTYSVTVSAVGGGILHSQTVQLTIR